MGIEPSTGESSTERQDRDPGTPKRKRARRPARRSPRAGAAISDATSELTAVESTSAPVATSAEQVDVSELAALTVGAPSGSTGTADEAKRRPLRRRRGRRKSEPAVGGALQADPSSPDAAEAEEPAGRARRKPPRNLAATVQNLWLLPVDSAGEPGTSKPPRRRRGRRRRSRPIRRRPRSRRRCLPLLRGRCRSRRTTISASI